MKTIIFLFAVVIAQAQTPAARPSFEVATVKPCTIEPGRGGGGAPSPGRLNVGCVPLRDLIQTAYSSLNGPQIKGGPSWIDDSFYEVNPKAADDALIAKMAGPMLQTLLEDRFALKIHRETKALPVFILTVARGGLKMQRAKEGSCVPVDMNHPPPALVPGQPGPCGPQSLRRIRSSNPGTIGVSGRGMAVNELLGTIIGSMLGGPVIDKTGLTDQFDFTLEWTPGGIDAPPDAPGPSIFTAVEEQLGLKVTSGKGPVEVIMIDHVERPSGN